MTSIEAFSRLSAERFARLIKSLDRTVLLDFFRRLEPAVYARYFKGFRPQVLGRKRVTEALRFEVYERKNETVGDILTMLWNQHHRDLYHGMLALVKTLADDVETIEKIEDPVAVGFIETLSARFDREDILICVRLNEVRFSDSVIAEHLEGQAPRPAAEPEDPASAGAPEPGSAPESSPASGETPESAPGIE